MSRRALPWRPPRHERLLLVLVAVVALSPVNIVSSQDYARLCLSRAFLRGGLTIGPCVGTSIDRSRYGGRTYSDKAPGLSILALPTVAAVRLPTAAKWAPNDNADLWAVRVLTSGVAFVLLAFCVGRLSEGIAPGTGGIALVAVGLGTILGPLAATTFDHVAAAALLFGAFLLAWGRRDVLGGLAAGAAVLVEYEAAIALPVFAVYLALLGSRRLLRFAAGAVAPLILLGAYDWTAFGSPLHPAYRYVSNRYAAAQATGLYGISLPRVAALHEMFTGDRGLLVLSPFLIAAVAGLVVCLRRYRLETAVAMTVAFLFLLLEAGYFLPYGGISPGPRFLAPAIPFLCLGLGPALQRWRVPTLALVVVSVIPTTALTLTWALSHDDKHPYRQTVWGEIARWLSQGSSSRLGQTVAPNALQWLGLGGTAATLLIALCVVTALVAASLPPRRLTSTLAHDA